MLRADVHNTYQGNVTGGTVKYMSPEQMMKAQPDPKSDVYRWSQ